MKIVSKYEPKSIEEKWYDFWLEQKINQGKPDASKKAYTIVIPPPNITGALHMGHALNNILQDVFIRFNKKRGFNTCWIPGTDHGGIATQNVMEKQLLQEGLTRHDIGRKAFLERMWSWRFKTGDTILMQLRKLGCLCDWDRIKFTMDDDCGDAVYESFKVLFEEGLIYRGNYLINWCPRCLTALSDIEVEHLDKNGHLWHINYPLKNNPEITITVATTRPETMLGDTAVAVNPQDERYLHLIGETLILPLTNREIPVIADDMVDMEFGTGCVKITPSHDSNDYETGKKHDLEFITVIDKQGKMTAAAGKYQSLERYKARKEIVQDLDACGYLKGIEKYKNKVSVCYRCQTVIEPLISPQWYVKTKEMAKAAIEASEEKRVEFLPATWEKPYLNWMKNLHDWCISRQIWWGHRIPIWYCDKCQTPQVAKDLPSECKSCDNKENFRQDEDVLDTWFSSALWPFSTLGWPKESKDLEYFYPTSVLATGHEILYLWVAKMIMMGLKFMGDVPFKNVYIHGIVRDSKGKKMSKSLGNVINPLDIIAKFSTDALRFTLITNGVMGRDLHIADDSFVMSRNFCNKLWNASRLILTNLQNEEGLVLKEVQELNNLELADKWMLSILQGIKKSVKKHYQKSDFSMVARELYEFIWSKYCDWYLELVKTRLYSKSSSKDRESVYSVLIFILSEILSMINPIIPFITEEINENIAKITGREHQSLSITNFPEYDETLVSEDLELEMQRVIDIVLGIRNIRGEMRVPPTKEIDVFIKIEQPLSALEITYIQKLTKAANIEHSSLLKKPLRSAVNITKDAEIYVPLGGLIDLEKEKSRLQKELANFEKELAMVTMKLNNENFIKRAPKAEVDKTKKKQEVALEKIVKVKLNLADME
ncbi:MAG: valine--tRNA ligase [bacterium]|nr:valine--tRNA ligase [bacterium]